MAFGPVQDRKAEQGASVALLQQAQGSALLLEMRSMEYAEIAAPSSAMQAAHQGWQDGHPSLGIEAASETFWAYRLARRFDRLSPL